MFNFECHQKHGKLIGSCIDGFLFGVCCNLTTHISEEESSPAGVIEKPASSGVSSTSGTSSLVSQEELSLFTEKTVQSIENIISIPTSIEVLDSSSEMEIKPQSSTGILIVDGTKRKPSYDLLTSAVLSTAIKINDKAAISSLLNNKVNVSNIKNPNFKMSEENFESFTTTDTPETTTEIITTEVAGYTTPKHDLSLESDEISSIDLIFNSLSLSNSVTESSSTTESAAETTTDSVSLHTYVVKKTSSSNSSAILGNTTSIDYQSTTKTSQPDINMHSVDVDDWYSYQLTTKTSQPGINTTSTKYQSTTSTSQPDISPSTASPNIANDYLKFPNVADDYLNVINFSDPLAIWTTRRPSIRRPVIYSLTTVNPTLSNSPIPITTEKNFYIKPNITSTTTSITDKTEETTSKKPEITTSKKFSMLTHLETSEKETLNTEQIIQDIIENMSDNFIDSSGTTSASNIWGSSTNSLFPMDYDIAENTIDVGDHLGDVGDYWFSPTKNTSSNIKPTTESPPAGANTPIDEFIENLFNSIRFSNTSSGPPIDLDLVEQVCNRVP